MQHLMSGEGSITAVRVGSGPDLVVIHSLLADRTAFDAVLPDLARSYRVTLLNLPGFEGTRPVAGTLGAYVGVVRRAFDEFEVGANAVLMGNGFGGTIALAFALEHPGLLGQLVLIDVAAAFPEPGKQAFRVMAETVRKSGMAAIAPIAAARVYHRAFIDDHPEAIEERRAVLLTIDASAFTAACEALVACDLTAALHSVTVPTAVIYGELDQATPPALNRLIARSIPFATEIAIPDCGHCPPLERPADFLAGVGPILGLSKGRSGRPPALR